MRTFLPRAVALAAASIVVLPFAAQAAVDDYAAEATTSAVRLSVFEAQTGAPLLDLVGTDAFVASDPMASAAVDALTVLGTSAGDVREATSTGPRQTDPESGDGCSMPAGTTGLTLDAVCSIAIAEAGAAGDIDSHVASATTDLLTATVDGSLLSTLLTGQLDQFLTDLADELGAGAVTEAIDAFTEECDLFLADPPEPLEEAPATVADLVGLSPVQLEAVNEEISDLSGSSPCTAIIALSTQDLVQDVVDVAPLADALRGVELLTVSVDGAQSLAEGTTDGLDATAEQVLVTVTGPSLSFLDDAINAIVQGMYDGFVTEIEEIAGQELPEEFDVSDELAAALDEVPLFGIDDPLLEATVSGGTVRASVAAADGATTAGGDEPFVTLTIAPGVVELLGGDPSQASVTLAAGQSQTIAEGTPAESTISVGAVTVDDAATLEDSSLTGSRATSSATTVTLLSGVEGGIELALAEASAGAFGATALVDSPDPTPELAETGGGAALTAVVALGAAAVLWRRRD